MSHSQKTKIRKNTFSDIKQITQLGKGMNNLVVWSSTASVSWQISNIRAFQKQCFSVDIYLMIIFQNFMQVTKKLSNYFHLSQHATFSLNQGRCNCSNTPLGNSERPRSSDRSNVKVGKLLSRSIICQTPTDTCKSNAEKA